MIITPAQVPKFEFDIGCRVLRDSLRKALADEKLRKEFEEWKVRRHAAKKEETA